MKLEEQVLSIEQMNHLKELEVEVEDTAMCWVKPNEHCQWDKSTDGSSSEYHILQSGMVHDYLFSEIVPTFTLQEILEMLPRRIGRYGGLYLSYNRGSIAYMDYGGFSFWSYDMCKNPLEAAYNMLCWCAENGFLNASKSMPLNK